VLLERGAVIDTQNIRGDTALHFAIRNRRTQAVQLLLEHGADVNVCDEDGETPRYRIFLRDLYSLHVVIMLLPYWQDSYTHFG
jgi:ankyrin repeat protein